MQVPHEAEVGDHRVGEGVLSSSDVESVEKGDGKRVSVAGRDRCKGEGSRRGEKDGEKG